MTASPAEGAVSSVRNTLVSPPLIRGDTNGSIDEGFWVNSTRIPTATQPGTHQTVASPVANVSSASIEDDRRCPTNHDTQRPKPPPIAPAPTLTSSILRSCVDLDALERKIKRSLAEDFPHLPAANPSRPTLLETLLQQIDSLPRPLPPVDLDALEAKIKRSLRDDFCHLEDPPDIPAPSADAPVPQTLPCVSRLKKADPSSKQARKRCHSVKSPFLRLRPQTRHPYFYVRPHAQPPDPSIQPVDRFTAHNFRPP